MHKGKNKESISPFGTPDDSTLFAEDEATSHGQIIGMQCVESGTKLNQSFD
jgi:hypothetical protein